MSRMATRPPDRVIAAPRRRFGKILVFAVLGVLLGTLAVLFLDRVYNPLEAGIGDRDLLVLAPEDADLLVFIPQVARFLGEIRDTPFSRTLAESREFQAFLRSDFARKTGAVEALSDAFRELDKIRGSPPLGLDLWNDISGEALLFAGYGPERPGAPWQFIAMFRPSSWMVLAAVNVLVDPVLGDVGTIRNGLESAGIKSIERYRDSVTLGFASGPPISLARIRNVVVVGTEVERITRLKTTIERDRIPASPAPRYADLAPDVAASPHEVRAIVRRSVADEQLQLSERLVSEWGRDNVTLVEATLPRFGGQDLLVTLSVDDAMDIKLGLVEGSPRQNDLSRSFRAFPRDEASAAFSRAAPLLPDSTFSFAHLSVDVPQFLDAFFQRPEIFSSADLANLADALRAVEEIDDLNGLKAKLARICTGKVSIGFFKQDREQLDKAAAGSFVAWQLQDEAELRRLLDAMEARIRERAAQGVRSALRDLVHERTAEADLYTIVLPEGVVDDARVTKLGLVVGRELLIVTNFIPSFRSLLQAGPLDGRVLPAEPLIATTLDRGPVSLRLGCAIAGDAIYGYFDHAAPGWAVQRTTPSARVESEWRANAQIDARARGLKDGTAEFERFVDDAYQRNLEEVLRIERPRVRREIDRYLGFFRGLIRSVGLTIGERNGVEIGLRIELNAGPP